jgi:ubiquinone/menaquinone biosynthesis C-methylase UbiE
MSVEPFGESLRRLWGAPDPSGRTSDARAYFAAKAPAYDDVDQQPYWAFSDALLWLLLRRWSNGWLQRISTFLDAGCGTARWSIRILEENPDAHALLLDATREMLAVAKQKIAVRGWSDRVTFLERDLNFLDPQLIAPQDLLICFHNVLSFVSDPQHVLHSLCRIIKPGGRLALVVPNAYHALYFSFSTGRWSEAERVRKHGTVRFTDAVPDMWVFTPSHVSRLLIEIGMRDVHVRGFPVTLYPGVEETSLRESSEGHVRLFDDPQRRDWILALESALAEEPDSAARGNNLLITATASE